MKKQVSEKTLFSEIHLRCWGFTMVEVIAAMAIMSTSLLAIFGTARSCSMAADRNHKLTRAVLIAETLLNEQMLDDQISYQSRQGQIDEYHWQVKISQTDIENLAKIKVTLTFKQQSIQQEYELISFLYIEPTVVSE